TAVRDVESSDPITLGDFLGPALASPRDKRVQRVARDTPPATDTSGRQSPCADPALNRAGRRPDPGGSLARTQFLGHRVAIVALGRPRAPRRLSRAMSP